jgi:hypothetical protein
MTRYTIPAAVTLAVTLHLAGCDKSPMPKQAEAAPTATITSLPLPSVALSPTGAAAAASTTSASQLPGAFDRDPIHALDYWRQAMERRDWAAAHRVSGELGGQSGLSSQQFAAAWDKYQTVKVTVGAGQQEGAAGSSYYEVPVTITGLTRADKPYRLAGRLTLRRVNDVEGATPEQLRWHIERSTLQP